jgi:hypothetical protein
VAFAVSGVAVMGILFGVLSGGITASVGPRRAILAGLSVSAVAGGAQALLPDFPLLMGLRVAEGAGHLLLVVAVPTLMAALAAEKDRSLVMGIWATFFGVGFSLAALLIGSAGPASVYAVHAALAAVLACVLWIMLPRGVTPERRRLPRLSDHVTIYTTPRLFAPALGHGIYAFLFLALVTYLPAAPRRTLALARPAGRGADRIAPDRAAGAPHRAGAARPGRVPRAGGVLRAGLGVGPARPVDRDLRHGGLGHRGGRRLRRRAVAQSDQCRPGTGQRRAGAARQRGHIRRHTRARRAGPRRRLARGQEEVEPPVIAEPPDRVPSVGRRHAPELEIVEQVQLHQHIVRVALRHEPQHRLIVAPSHRHGHGRDRVDGAFRWLGKGVAEGFAEIQCDHGNLLSVADGPSTQGDSPGCGKTRPFTFCSHFSVGDSPRLA